MKQIKYLGAILLISMLSSCTLVNLGLAYIGYSIVLIIAIAIFMFLFSIIYGITKNQSWSIVLTVFIAFMVAAYIFKW